MLKICGIIVILLHLILFSVAATAQAIDPQRSARAAQQSDGHFISGNIADNEDAMYLSRKGAERGGDSKVKELAQEMLANHTQILYGFQQLENAGTGSHAHDPGAAEQQNKFMTDLNGKLAMLSGPEFDSVWVANLLMMQETKYSELTQAKETVTNPQLIMAITAAVPLLRKEISQLKSIQKHLIRVETQKRKEEQRKKAEEQRNKRK